MMKTAREWLDEWARRVDDEYGFAASRVDDGEPATEISLALIREIQIEAAEHGARDQREDDRGARAVEIEDHHVDSDGPEFPAPVDDKPSAFVCPFCRKPCGQCYPAGA